VEQEHASTSLTRPEAETLLKVAAFWLVLLKITLSSIIMVAGGSGSRYESEGEVDGYRLLTQQGKRTHAS